MQTQTSGPRPIICVGALHWDIVAQARELIRPETSTPSRFSQQPGGVATNVARALARLDVPTSLVGAVGADPAADAILKVVREDRVTAHVVVRADSATGQYVALHDPDGSLPAACVDDRILSDLAPADLIARMNAAIASQPGSTCFVDANLSPACLETLFKLASEHEIQLAGDTVSAAKAGRFTPHLAALSLLFCNKAEAARLTGLEESASVEAHLDALLRAGCRQVVLTSGAREVWFADVAQRFSLTPPPADIVDVTGAGDALIAGFLAGQSRGLEPKACLHCGLSAARLALQSTGAVPDTLDWQIICRDT